MEFAVLRDEGFRFAELVDSSIFNGGINAYVKPVFLVPYIREFKFYKSITKLIKESYLILWWRKMSDLLRTEIHLLNDRIKYYPKSENNPEILSDYYPPSGNNEGYKSLELSLISFRTCVRGTVSLLLRRMQKEIESYTMTVAGIRKSEHPTGFNKIILKSW